jgi:DNA invertase Pin-like site-specific DNA recombinase
MEVIIAARLSQLHDGSGQIGLDTQDEDAQEWAEDNGHNVVATVADAKSGTTAMWERPNLRPWVTQLDLMARYQGIVAATQDRLSRAKFWDEVELRKWAEDNGKTLFIVDKNMKWPPDDEDDVTRWNDGAAQARAEWSKTSRRYRRMQRGKIARGSLVGRATYGLQIVEATGKDGKPIKTLAPFEPEASVIREAATRYLDGETIDAICADLDARGIASPMWKGRPGTHWYAKTLAGLLRSPSIAGRRYPRNEHNLPDMTKPPIATYEPIISWDEHLRLVARLDSRAHRAGISPGNVALLTSVLFDAESHPMYRLGTLYYCRRCRASVKLAKMDADISALFAKSTEPYLIPQLVPGANHSDEIARLRQDRSELDDLSDDYDARHAELTRQIRELAREDAEHPNPDRIEWVDSHKTYGQVWQAMTTAERRDMMLAAGFRVIWLGDGRYKIRPGTMTLDLPA